MCRVDVYNRQREVFFRIPVDSIEKLVFAVLESESECVHSLSIHFLSDKAMRRYHKQFFGDASPTDCMSFPLDDARDHGIRHAGDIFVCPLTAIRYIQKSIFKAHSLHGLVNGETLSDEFEELFWKEIALYIVHSVLHLFGYDDTSPASRALMRRQERRALALLRKQQIVLSGTVRLQKSHLQCGC